MSKTSNFRPKYIKLVDKYLDSVKDEEYTFQKMKGKTDGFEEKTRVNLPSIEGFCVYVKVARSVVYLWRDSNDYFKEALEKIKVAQKIILVNKGLGGQYSPVISKLILSSDHGLREKSDITSDDAPIGGFTDEQVDRIAERLTARKGTVSSTPVAK